MSKLLLKKRMYMQTVAMIGCFLVSIAACVIVLLLIPVHSNSSAVHVWSGDVCATRACDRHARFLRETMQPSADKCREFGTVMCGRWKHDHAVSTDVDALVRKSALRQGAQFLRSGSGKLRATQEAGRMLKSCLEQQFEQSTRRAALRYFRDFLRDRGLPWPNEPAGDRHPLDVLLDLSINWRIDLWFGLRLRRNRRNRLQVTEAPVALATMVRAEHADELEAVAEAMFYAEAVGAGLQYTKPRAEAVSRRQSRVLGTFKNISSLNPRLKRMRVSRVANLEEWAPAVTSSQWLAFLRKHLSGTIQVRAHTEVLIDSVDYFAAIGSIFKESVPNELVDVIGWWMVRLFADLGGVAVSYDERAQAFSPAVCERRVEACYGLVLAAEMVKQYWTAQHAKAVDDIFTAVRHQAVILVQRLSWMDAVSKKHIVRKLDALKVTLANAWWKAHSCDYASEVTQDMSLIHKAFLFFLCAPFHWLVGSAEVMSNRRIGLDLF
ncbi:neprilysin-1-like [Dermacentor variabilis]|uniref:neprilysin-1-like n=1 Tax=Dermacentor variabilis TaxID=34621 RepID=UPI003F5AFEDE